MAKNKKVENLIKAALKAYRLLDGGVMPTGNYGGSNSDKYKKQCDRIDRAVYLLDNAISDLQEDQKEERS